MSTSQRQNQVSLLRSQAEQVFKRKAFELAVWVGVFFGPFSWGMQAKSGPIDIVIFYNPNYSEEQIWGSYSCEENPWGADPDEPKLERAWDRKVKISRIFRGTLRYYE